MITKHQQRSIKRLENIGKQKEKFPEMLRRIVESSDIILEILDARFIEETRNKEVEKFIKKNGKKIIYVLNKSDLARKGSISENKLKEIQPNVLVSVTERRGGKELRNKIKHISKSFQKNKGFEKVSVGVIGYPNTGKSSIINLLVGKNSAGTGSAAGFTKGIQKLKLTEKIVLIDSPGVIPSKEDSMTNQEKMSREIMTSARDYNRIKNPENAVAYLFEKYKLSFEEFYKIQIENAEDLIEKVGRKNNILKKGGVVNEDAVSRRIIRDWQEGKIQI
jgi:hypothetical protein